MLIEVHIEDTVEVSDSVEPSCERALFAVSPVPPPVAGMEWDTFIRQQERERHIHRGRGPPGLPFSAHAPFFPLAAIWSTF
jgi:hypothetical protein